MISYSTSVQHSIYSSIVSVKTTSLYIVYDDAHDNLDERHNLKPKSATPLNLFLDQHLDILAPTCEVCIAHN